MATVEGPAELFEPGALQRSLNEAFPSAPAFETCVVLHYEGKSQCSATAVSPARGSEAETATFQVGCISKLFVATLVAKGIARGQLTMECSVGSLLGPSDALDERLRGVTVGQLLNHSHGLDDAAIRRAPLDSHGRIDVHSLTTQLGTRLFEPGRYYSYASIGAWLLSAILERQHGRRIEDIFQDELFAPLHIQAHRAASDEPAGEPPYFCPASGASLALTARGLLEFLRAHLEGEATYWVASAESQLQQASLVPVPGLSPVERGAQLGWKVYGTGWFGHNSTLLRSPAILRVHPERQIAFAVTSSHRSPIAVATRLFGKLFPGFAELQRPHAMSAEELRHFDPAPFVGTYANMADSIRIRSRGRASLELEAIELASKERSAAPTLVAELKPARHNLFYLRPADSRWLPFVQFIGSREQCLTHLWNGTSLRLRQQHID